MKLLIIALCATTCVCLCLSSPTASSAKVGADALMTVVAPAQAADQSAEKEAIKLVVRQYLDVTDNKAQENIAKAFHPTTKFFSVGKGTINQMTLDEWWQRISRIQGKVERTSTIALIDVTGIAAVVRVDFGRSSDYLSLLKVGGEWKIVNKTLSTPLNV